MLKSYEAIYDHGQLQWLGTAPNFKRARVVLVVDDTSELEAPSERDLVAGQLKNGARLVSILRATPLELSASIAEKYGDPVEWQREQRQERVLPGRQDA
ncbi:MAG: hypothetical protein HOP02_14450 [Methylococcaceae bacterium]|nr:hypothetical protein [Methylococcaceae bacterium]